MTNSSTTMGDFRRERRRDPYVQLTASDVQALRAEVQQCAFLHWGRIAQMWGVTIGLARDLGGSAAAKRYDARKRKQAAAPQ
jgi:hypothetical protein